MELVSYLTSKRQRFSSQASTIVYSNMFSFCNFYSIYRVTADHSFCMHICHLSKMFDFCKQTAKTQTKLKKLYSCQTRFIDISFANE